MPKGPAVAVEEQHAIASRLGRRCPRARSMQPLPRQRPPIDLSPCEQHTATHDRTNFCERHVPNCH
eukprot:5185725-Prymnesium_polylepis.1